MAGVAGEYGAADVPEGYYDEQDPALTPEPGQRLGDPLPGTAAIADEAEAVAPEAGPGDLPVEGESYAERVKREADEDEEAAKQKKAAEKADD